MSGLSGGTLVSFEETTIKMLVELKEDVAIIKQKMRVGESIIGRAITILCAIAASLLAGRFTK